MPMGDLFLRSALAGAGHSFGRDVYRKTKKSAGDIIVIAIFVAIILAPGWAGYDMYRGNSTRTQRPNRLVLNMILSIVPFLIALLLHYKAVDGQDAASLFYSVQSLLYVAVASFIFWFLGSLLGRLRARKRYASEDREAERRAQEAAIQQENDRFLADNGLQFDRHTEMMVDQSGNVHREIEDNGTKTTFLIVGRRGKRAYLYRDQDGIFIEYSGIISL